MGITEIRGKNVGGGGGDPVRPNVACSPTKRSKIIPTRHVFWSQNIPKFFYGRGFVPEPAAPPDLLTKFGNRFAEGKRGKGEGRKWEGTRKSEKVKNGGKTLGDPCVVVPPTLNHGYASGQL